MLMKINLHEGIDDIRFGMTLTEVEAIFGKANAVETDSDGDVEVLFAEYEDKGLSLCFEKDANEQKVLLADITPYDEETTLFGSKIYKLTKDQICRLCKQNGLKDAEVDSNFNGEEMLLFEEADIAFFFENDVLVSVSFSR